MSITRIINSLITLAIFSVPCYPQELVNRYCVASDVKKKCYYPSSLYVNDEETWFARSSGGFARTTEIDAFGSIFTVNFYLRSYSDIFAKLVGFGDLPFPDTGEFTDFDWYIYASSGCSNTVEYTDFASVLGSIEVGTFSHKTPSSNCTGEWKQLTVTVDDDDDIHLYFNGVDYGVGGFGLPERDPETGALFLFTDPTSTVEINWTNAHEIRDLSIWEEVILPENIPTVITGAEPALLAYYDLIDEETTDELIEVSHGDTGLYFDVIGDVDVINTFGCGQEACATPSSWSTFPVGSPASVYHLFLDDRIEGVKDHTSGDYDYIYSDSTVPDTVSFVIENGISHRYSGAQPGETLVQFRWSVEQLTGTPTTCIPDCGIRIGVRDVSFDVETDVVHSDKYDQNFGTFRTSQVVADMYQFTGDNKAFQFSVDYDPALISGRTFRIKISAIEIVYRNLKGGDVWVN